MTAAKGNGDASFLGEEEEEVAVAETLPWHQRGRSGEGRGEGGGHRGGRFRGRYFELLKRVTRWPFNLGALLLLFSAAVPLALQAFRLEHHHHGCDGGDSGASQASQGAAAWGGVPAAMGASVTVALLLLGCMLRSVFVPLRLIATLAPPLAASFGTGVLARPAMHCRTPTFKHQPSLPPPPVRRPCIAALRLTPTMHQT